MIECKLLGRRGVGFDINPRAVELARRNLVFDHGGAGNFPVRVELGDARSLRSVPDEVADLVATHPPYASIIRYSEGAIIEDLSSHSSLEDFFVGLRQVAGECWRVLKAGGHCAVLMGDTRKRGHFVPLTSRLLWTFLEAGFVLREEIIKLQWNTRSERQRWTNDSYSFYKIAHERLFIFRKLSSDEEKAAHAESMKWW